MSGSDERRARFHLTSRLNVEVEDDQEREFLRDWRLKVGQTQTFDFP